VQRAVKLIQGSDEQHSYVRDALASAGTPAAQRALVSLMDHYGDDGQQRVTLIGLSMVTVPTPETVGYLRSMRDDPVHGRQARYGLGSATRRLLARAPEEGEAVLEELTSSLADATTETDRSDYVTALGNTRSPTAYESIVATLDDPSPVVRSAAVRALLHQQGPEVDGVVARVATADPVDIVRLSGVEVLRDRRSSPPLLSALDSILRLDRSLLVRRQALVVAAGKAPAAPLLRESIAWVASNDPVAELRELAARYAAGHPLEGQ